jgi:hypothetical protein
MIEYNYKCQCKILTRVRHQTCLLSEVSDIRYTDTLTPVKIGEKEK